MAGRAAVRSRLIELQEDVGCDVKVVVANAEQEAWLEQTVGGRHLNRDKVRVLKHQHNKLMIFDAYYAGAWRQAVFAGSHNHLDGGSSLRHTDDVMLRIIHPDIHHRYVTYFRAMYLAE